MTRVTIGKFRDRASELIRRAAGGETVVILNRDREVAKLVPIRAATGRSKNLIGCLAGTAQVRGDIEAPIARPQPGSATRCEVLARYAGVDLVRARRFATEPKR